MLRLLRGSSLSALIFWVASTGFHCDSTLFGQDSISSDEALLRSVGLTTKGQDLLNFFRLRSAGRATTDRLTELINRLGAATPVERDRACAELIGIGPPAIPSLRQAARDPDQVTTAELARRCLRALEEDSIRITSAALRLLAQRRPDEAAGTILAFLPVAEDEVVLEEARKALVIVAFRAGKIDPALEKALEDRSVVRRVATIDVLTRHGGKGTLALLRGLLRDPAPTVRVRAAQALASHHEAEAIGILIESLGELPHAQGAQVEEFLTNLAGESAPKITLMDQDDTRRDCRDAWRAWWQQPPPALRPSALLEELRKRSLTENDHVKIQTLIEALGNDSFEVREKGSEELKLLGVRTIPLLRQAARSLDVEVSQRARALLQEIDKERLSPPSPLVFRLLAVRKPVGAIEVLLNYLPNAEDDSLAQQAQQALNVLAGQEGPPDPALIRALQEPSPRRRVAAAEALCGAPSPEALPSVRKLLTDPDALVRARVAQSLARARDREAIPVLIALIGELPAEQAQPIEDYLRSLASDRPPSVEGTDRRKRQETWSAWWTANATRIELPERSQVPSRPLLLGYTLLIQNNQVIELDQAGKVRWTLTGLGNAYDAQVLPRDRVLVAEYGVSRVSERNLQGEILWQHLLPASPVNVQRLSSGNTFIATRDQLLEVDRAGKEVYALTRPSPDVISGWRTPQGQIVCLTNQGLCIWMDQAGRELRQFRLQGTLRFGNQLLPNGHLLAPHSTQNKVIEYDPEGKIVWQANVAEPVAVCRLPSGNTLVCRQFASPKLVELDPAGKVLAESNLAAFTIRVDRR